MCECRDEPTARGFSFAAANPATTCVEVCRIFTAFTILHCLAREGSDTFESELCTFAGELSSVVALFGGSDSLTAPSFPASLDMGDAAAGKGRSLAFGTCMRLQCVRATCNSTFAGSP